MKKKICVLGLALSVMLAACGNKNTEKTAPELLEPAMSISNTVKVEKGSISNSKMYKGEIIPYTEENSFDKAGSVETVFVREGDRVKKGDKLAVLIGGIDNGEKKDIENQLASYKKNCSVENLEAEYDIKIMKLEKDMLAEDMKNAKGAEKKKMKKEYDIKIADIKIAEQNLVNTKELQAIEIKELERKRDSLNTDIDSYYLYASMDGIVSFVAVNNNDMVEKGVLAVAISDESRLHVRTEYVLQSEYMGAKRSYIQYGDNTYDVEMRDIDITQVKEQLSMGIPVSSYFDIKNPDKNLKIGDCIDLNLETDNSDDTLYLPINAVYVENEQAYVYLYKDGRRIKTDVEQGISNSTYVEILSGVEEGDDVYVKP